jgi:molecular chaperone DnaK (HSP70)
MPHPSTPHELRFGRAIERSAVAAATPFLAVRVASTSVIAAALGADGRPLYVPDRQGRTAVPATVTFDSSLGYMVGLEEGLGGSHAAQASARDLGTETLTVVGSQSYSPTHITALILQSVKQNAEEYFGRPFASALTIVSPAAPREYLLALSEAFALAGLPLVRVLHDPSAAILVKMPDRDRCFLVIDLADDEFSVSLAHGGDGVVDPRSVSGQRFAAADLFDDDMRRTRRRDIETHITRALRATETDPAEIERVLVTASDAGRLRMLESLAAAMFRARPIDAALHLVLGGLCKQGAVMAGVEKDLLLLTVLPQGLGVRGMPAAGSADHEKSDADMMVSTDPRLNTETYAIVTANTSFPTRKTIVARVIGAPQVHAVTVTCVEEIAGRPGGYADVASLEVTLPEPASGPRDVIITIDVDANRTTHMLAQPREGGVEQRVEVLRLVR